MKQYYIKDLNPPDQIHYHCIGFSDAHPSLRFFQSYIDDAKFHLLHYDFNNIKLWNKSTNGYQETVCTYYL